MTEQPLIRLQEKRDIGQVLNTTFAFLRLTFRYIFKDMLLLVSPFFIIPGIFMAIQQYNIYSFSYTFSGQNPATLIFSPFYYLYLLGTAIGWTMAFSITGNYVYQYNQTGSANFDVQAVRAAARRDFFKVLGTFILFYIVVVFGTILLIIPGIYFGIANSLGGTNVILDKNSTIGTTFGESRRLVNDNWWRTLGFGILTGLIVYAFTMVFSIPSMVYTFILQMHMTSGNPEDYKLPFILFNVLTHLATALVTPVSVVASCIYYYSLKEEKDQVSLVQKIDNLGKNDETKVNEGGF